jgi:hypothetical protein
MFLIPLNQLESVELVIHSLKMAAGEADCTTCPAYKVCMKQCLTIASAVEDMLHMDALPRLERPEPAEPLSSGGEAVPPSNGDSPKGRGRLKIVK